MSALLNPLLTPDRPDRADTSHKQTFDEISLSPA